MCHSCFRILFNYDEIYSFCLNKQTKYLNIWIFKKKNSSTLLSIRWQRLLHRIKRNCLFAFYIYKKPITPTYTRESLPIAATIVWLYCPNDTNTMTFVLKCCKDFFLFIFIYFELSNAIILQDGQTIEKSRQNKFDSFHIFLYDSEKNNFKILKYHRMKFNETR